MRSRVYWFSGSGNSLHVARRLAEALGAELTPVTKALEAAEAAASGGAADSGDAPGRVILVYPTYGGGPPNLVQRFLPVLPATVETGLLAVTTCGGMAASALGMADAALRRRGLALAGGWVVRMPDNYPPFGGPPPAKKQAEKNRSAEAAIDAIIHDIRNDRPRRLGLLSRLGRPFGTLMNRFAGKHWHETARHFAATDACTRCGVCVRVCPVRNVALTENGPAWGERCEACFACLHWCPESAVTHKGKHPKNGRYHHPGVALGDILPQGTAPADAATPS
jgi:ferredoxin